MSKKIRKTENRHIEMIEQALACLAAAREYLKLAECPATLKKVRSAIKSADGARRHALGAQIRQDLATMDLPQEFLNTGETT